MIGHSSSSHSSNTVYTSPSIPGIHPDRRIQRLRQAYTSNKSSISVPTNNPSSSTNYPSSSCRDGHIRINRSFDAHTDQSTAFSSSSFRSNRPNSATSLGSQNFDHSSPPPFANACCSLRPPPGQVLRASSFDGVSGSEATLQHSNQSTYTPPFRSNNSPRQLPEAPVKRSPLKFCTTPSIEISLVGDKPEQKRRPKLVRQRHSIYEQESSSEQDMSSSKRGLRRVGDGRQEVNSGGSSSLSISPALSDSKVDDFEFFKRIANPSRSANLIPSPNSPSSRDTHHQRNSHAIASRSHSMRIESNQPHYRSSREFSSSNNSSSSSFNLVTSSPMNSPDQKLLKPPPLVSRGQLRRASTSEDDRHLINRSSQHHQPATSGGHSRSRMKATLSYHSVSDTSRVSAGLKTPPSSIPNISEPGHQLLDESMPLGVPLTVQDMRADEPGMTYYQVQLLGAQGVGKTALARQFAALNESNPSLYDLDDEEASQPSYTVSANVDGSIYSVEFVESSTQSFDDTLEIELHDCIDAFIVLYAIDDFDSSDAAQLMLNALLPIHPSSSPTTTGSSSLQSTSVVFLVGNKTDLVRARQISSEEGRSLANKHGARFMEVSASINHLVPDLFVGLISQLKATEARDRDPRLPVDRVVSSIPSYFGMPDYSFDSRPVRRYSTSRAARHSGRLVKFFKKAFHTSS